ncbi:OpgC domain-containing protein [Thaumasiovibrio subtropicus]|uniref:OpgC domain-containing protein n=1 Tax=Thaumasiovibrio subtropicus TaxID=1891207 RepID=UPI00131A9F73|nr:OpgC domain-containing protein [Thaumasiovibrio subtropicus]
MKRIEGLDSLRGVLLIFMTINHLIWISGGWSRLQWVTLQPLGQVGAAEGFIFISGLLAGLIYSKPEMSQADVTRKAWHRAATIYFYHIGCLILVCAWFIIAPHFFGNAHDVLAANLPNFIAAPVQASLLSTVLLNRPFYFDILPIYILFMLALPLAIALFRKGLSWLVLVLSFGLWVLASYLHQDMLKPLYAIFSEDLSVSVGYFDPFAWQLLFIVGAAIGFRQRTQPIHWFKHTPVTVVVFIATLLFTAAHHGAFAQFGLHQGIMYALADKPELGWLRVLNLGLLAYVIGWLIHRFPSYTHTVPLSLLGKHSLQVFAWQSILIFLAAPALTSIRMQNSYAFVILALTATLFIPAMLSQRKASRGVTPIFHWGTVAVGLLAVSLSAKAIESALKPAPVSFGDTSFSLKVKVENLKDMETDLMVLLYAEHDSLMGPPSAFGGSFSPEAVSQGVELGKFKSAKYALFVLQDRDKNNQLTFSSVGMPMEPFGYSNNPRLNGPPSMDDIGFNHLEDNTQTVSLIHF